MRLSRMGVAAVAALGMCASANSGEKEKTWVEVRSAHFTVVTDLGAKRGMEVARHCEQMHSAFTLLMNKAKTGDPARLLIFALDGQREVDGLLHRASGGKHSGLYLLGPDRSFILVDASGDPWHALYHEYAHQLLSANVSAAMQAWFEEGFADYFSTMQADSKATRLGLVPVAELQFLRKNGKLMRLGDLIAVRPDSPLYNENGPLQATFYAQSWLLVHYLFDHQLIAHAQPFGSRIAHGEPLESATRAEFGLSPTQLESELLNYAKGERFRYFALHAVEVPQDITVSGLSSITAQALQSDVRWHANSQHSKEEVASYSEALRSLLKQEPTNSVVLQQLASLAVDPED